MTLQVMGNRVMIAPLEKKSKLPSGLILPPTAQEEQTMGIVLAVGPGDVSEKSGVSIPIDEIEPGDIVLHSKYGGTEIEHEGETVLIMSPRDIFAVVKKEEGDA